MQLEPLGAGDRAARAGQSGRGLADLDLGHAAAKLAWRQRGPVPGGPRGGQDVVGAGNVIRKRGPARPPHQQAPGAPDAGRQGLGVRTEELQVLGGEGLGQGESRLQAIHAYQSTGPRRTLGSDAQPLEIAGDFLDRLLRGGHRDHEALGAVLCLREQVCGNQFELGRIDRVEHDHQIARALEAVDAHVARHLPLGLLHVEVARAGDHVHSPHLLGPVGERRDRVRPAHRKHLVHAAQPAGGQDRGVYLAVETGRRADHDLVHPGDPGGYGAHDHGARVGRAAARHVDPGAAHRDFAQQYALPLLQRHLDVVPQAGTSHGGDVGHGQRQAGPHLGIEPGERRLDRRGRDSQGVSGGWSPTGERGSRGLCGSGRLRRSAGLRGSGVGRGGPSDVELPDAGLELLLSPLAHAGDDLGHPLAHRRRLRHQRAQLRSQHPSITGTPQLQSLNPHAGAPRAHRWPPL